MINFTIDGIQISVPKGTTVYAATQQLGIDIPIFCYHNKMPPFGACRVCLVEVEKAGKLQTSCTLEATEGMVVKTQSAMAIEGREDILELLLINHPLDCPICDKGGECPLQEQTMNHGPGKSRFFEEKRHFKKPLPLGPVLNLDRERCIICARCTRFGDIVAGDHALELLDRGYRSEVGTHDAGPAESKFIGNTIMICPVGALTSNVYRFRARPWDNKPTSSTCTLCPVGCSMILDERDGEIMRTRSQEDRDVNDIWLCDKGWFGYEFSSHADRLQQPLIRRNGVLQPTTWEEALSLVAIKIQEFKPQGKLAGLGGNPLTIEENYLFQKLMRECVEVNHVDHRMETVLWSLDEEGIAPGMEISMGECENLSFVLLLGLDLTEEFPVVWLRLKEAINRGAKVIFIGHYAPEIARHMTQIFLHPSGDELENLEKVLQSFFPQSGKRAIFIGRQYLCTPHRKELLASLLKWRGTHPSRSDVSLNIMEGRGNSMGARLAGMRPDVGALGAKVDSPGLNMLQVLQQAAKSGWDFLYVAGGNIAKKVPSKLWEEVRSRLNFLVVQDIFLTETACQADVVLPTLSFVEKSGSFMNIEGRIRRLCPGKQIPTEIYSDGEIFTWLAWRLNASLVQEDNFTRAVESYILRTPRPSMLEAAISPDESSRESLRESSKEALLATFVPALFDQGVRMQHNVHLSQLAKEPYVRLHPLEAEKRGLRENDSVTLKTFRENPYGKSISAKIKLDIKVAQGTLVIPVGFKELTTHDLCLNLINGIPLTIGKI
jgi:NADH-quinone oxidoreductase subunit G